MYEKGRAVATIAATRQIVNAVLLDFDHDGILDVMLQTAAQTDKIIRHVLFLGTEDGLLRAAPEEWTVDAGDQLAMLDYHGSMHIDMLGRTVDGKTGLWSSMHGGGWEDPATGFAADKPAESFCTLAMPQSSVFADFNGDGRADILLACQDDGDAKHLELWTALPGGGFHKQVEHALPPGAGQIVAADVDGDGTLDLLFPVCHPPGTCSSESSLHVVFNVHPRPYCRHLFSSDSCKSRDDLFGTAETVKFETKVIPCKDIFGYQRHFLMRSTGGTPTGLHVGDYNLDGYPDILAISSTDPDRPEAARVVLLRNIPGSEGRRTFELVTEHAESLNELHSPVAVAFAGFSRDGLPDILVNHFTRGGIPKLTVLRNGYYGDYFFVRSEAVAAFQRRSTDSLYGSVHPGVTFKFAFTDFDGTHRVRQGSQVSATSYGSLPSPTCLFGLGRTNNFIDAFGVAYPVAKPSALQSAADSHEGAATFYWHRFNGVIPNSDIIISPPSPNDPVWRLRLLLNPGEYIQWVAGSVLVAMAVLAILTSILKYREYVLPSSFTYLPAFFVPVERGRGKEKAPAACHQFRCSLAHKGGIPIKKRRVYLWVLWGGDAISHNDKCRLGNPREYPKTRPSAKRLPACCIQGTAGRLHRRSIPRGRLASIWRKLRG